MLCLFVCLFVRPVSEPKMDAIDKLETEYNDLEESNSWMDVFQVSNSVFSYTFLSRFDLYRFRLKEPRLTRIRTAIILECQTLDEHQIQPIQRHFTL